ncbi:unnamed protein product, partial [Polarella glacialis]
LMKFDSASIDLGIRLARCLFEAGDSALDKLRRHGILKMIRQLATTPELLHQPPRPQHIRLAAAQLLERLQERLPQAELALPISGPLG